MSEKAVIYFDKVCKLCNTWMQIILRADKNKSLRIVALQSEEGEKVANIIREKHGNADTVIYEKNGAFYIRSEAVIQCLSDIGGIWSLVKIFRMLPLKFRNAVYDMIARNRYKWFGKTDSCKIISES